MIFFVFCVLNNLAPEFTHYYLVIKVDPTDDTNKKKVITLNYEYQGQAIGFESNS